LLFNSPEFIIFFVSILIILAIIKHRRFQHLFLLGASYFFFFYTSNYLIVLLIFSSILDFYVGKEIWNATSKTRKKILLIISLGGNLGLLGFFKYADFAILQFNLLGQSLDLANEFQFLNLALPIGISFYTFQTISYTVEIYRGKLHPSNSIWEFALFVSFFPQLVSGPIVRASVFLPQLREKMENFDVGSKLRQLKIHSKTLKLGITMMSFGFLKKMFFADNIAPLVNDVFSNPVGQESFSIILATIGFGIQIYGDFSGYTDIAIGAALIMGFKIPINFNKPYFAVSPIDFWRRWHISLSSWLRDYLYIPLGGNRKSKGRTYFNLFTVMFLGGLWHGASWNFVLWGVLHGSYLAIQKAIGDKFPFLKNHWFFKSKLGKIVSILVTQYLVFLAWIPFRVSDFGHAMYSIEKFVFVDFQTSETIQLISEHRLPVILIFLFIILHSISYKNPQLIMKMSKFKLRYWAIVITIIMVTVFFFFDANPIDFLYFKF